MTEARHYKAQGKLLLTGEYVVLDGALALAVPSPLGQSLTIEPLESQEGADLLWRSLDDKGAVWFEARFQSGHIVSTTDGAAAQKLLDIFAFLEKNSPKSLYAEGGALQMTTALSFPRLWGLGTSSTLIYNIAQAYDIDPYALLAHSFGGSGYDIACAGATEPLFFQRHSDHIEVEKAPFSPIFKDNLYFIYLNQKQNSREGIARYRSKKQQTPQYVAAISALSHAFCTATDLASFDKLIVEHEQLIAELIELPRAKTLYFDDFWGEIKSLGAWGGDFVMATSNRSLEETQAYFNQKGFDTCLTYDFLLGFGHQNRQ